MMRSLPSWVWLVLAVVSGTMASFLALGWLKGQARIPETPVKVSVVVARQEIAPGTLLTLGQMQVKDGWPGAPPRGTLSRLAEA